MSSSKSTARSDHDSLLALTLDDESRLCPALKRSRLATMLNVRDSHSSSPDPLLSSLLPRMAASASDTLRQKDRKSTRLNSSHSQISYAVFCLKKKKKKH